MRNAELLVSVLFAARAILFAGCSSAAGVVVEPTLTPESDAEVQSAVSTLPPGATAPKPIRIVQAKPTRQYRSGTRLHAVLDIVVTVDGRIKVVAIKKSDDPAFASACVRAVVQNHFAPARTADGRAVAMRSPFECSFVAY